MIITLIFDDRPVIAKPDRRWTISLHQAESLPKAVVNLANYLPERRTSSVEGCKLIVRPIQWCRSASSAGSYSYTINTSLYVDIKLCKTENFYKFVAS